MAEASSSNTTSGKTGTSGKSSSRTVYPRFLTSPTFKILIGPSLKAFYIHKTLLGTISKEFHAHTHNDMKEGKENSMVLDDVIEETMEKFLEWAYTGDYPDAPGSAIKKDADSEDEDAEVASITSGIGLAGLSTSALGSTTTLSYTPSACLMVHARLYVLADRFNVMDLKHLAFDKLTAILADLDYLSDARDIKDAIAMIYYAFENLPLKSSGNASPKEKLLAYLVKYAAWQLRALRGHDVFWELIESNLDFAKEMLKISNEAEEAPWKDAGTKTSSKKQSKKSKSTARRKEEALKRRCNSCSWTGSFLLQCGSCAYLDPKINGCGEYLEGVTNLTGSGTSLRHTCPYCGWGPGNPRLHCSQCYNTSYSYV